MTGLDKMINQILDEANNSAKETLEEAREKAEEIMNQAREEANKKKDEILKKSQDEIETYKERAASSADLKRRTALLEAKQEIISQVLAQAYEKFISQEESQYFKCVEEMLEKFVLAQKGEIYFSQKDLDRMPSGFAKKAEEIAREKGGQLSLSETARKIDGGFILVYGGIEENCSIKAMFDSRKEELQDRVHKVLFA